jgi:hypothetical protein
MRTSIPSLPWLRHLAATVLVSAAAHALCTAATLPFDAPLHTQPDEGSPVVGTLPAGTSINSMLREDLAAAGLEPPPPGWIVLRSGGPFPGFVLNREVNSDGTIKPGAQIRGQPLTDAPLLLVVEDGDIATAREPLGDWSRASIQTELIVYINALPVASRPQASAEPPALESEPAAVEIDAAEELVIDTPPPAAATAEKPK